MAEDNFQINIVGNPDLLRKSLEKGLKDLSIGVDNNSLRKISESISQKVTPKLTFDVNLTSAKQLQSKISAAIPAIKIKVIPQSDGIKEFRKQLKEQLSPANLGYDSQMFLRIHRILKDVNPAKFRWNAETEQSARDFKTKAAAYFNQNPIVVSVRFAQTNRDLKAIGQNVVRNETANLKKSVAEQVVASKVDRSAGLRQAVPTVNNAVEQNVRAVENVNRGYKDYITLTKTASQETLSFAERIGFTTSRLAAYLIPAGAIFQLTRAFQVARQSIIAIDADINKLTQIFNGNSERAKKLANDVLEIATRYGQSGQELLKTTLILAQAGDKFTSDTAIKDTLDSLAKTQVLATFGSLDDTIEGLLAVLNQFNLTAEDTNQIIDVTNTLSKQFAVESSNIFEAVRTGGAAFAIVGGDFKDFAATVTAVRETTRLSASTIGTSLNTIALRLLRTDTVQFLEQFTGDQIRDAQGNLRGIADIFIEIGRASKGKSAEELSELIEKLSGVRQGKALIPLIQDISRGPTESTFLKALSRAQSSPGSATRDAIIALDRLDVILGSVIGKFDQVFKDISQDRGIKDLAKDFASLASSLADVLKVVGPLVPTLTKLATIKLGVSLASGIPSLIKGASIYSPGPFNPASAASATTTYNRDDYRRISYEIGDIFDPKRYKNLYDIKKQDDKKFPFQALYSIRGTAYDAVIDARRNIRIDPEPTKRTDAEAQLAAIKSGSFGAIKSQYLIRNTLAKDVVGIAKQQLESAEKGLSDLQLARTSVVGEIDKFSNRTNISQNRIDRVDRYQSALEQRGKEIKLNLLAQRPLEEIVSDRKNLSNTYSYVSKDKEIRDQLARVKAEEFYVRQQIRLQQQNNEQLKRVSSVRQRLVGNIGAESAEVQRRTALERKMSADIATAEQQRVLATQTLAAAQRKEAASRGFRGIIGATFVSAGDAALSFGKTAYQGLKNYGAGIGTYAGIFAISDSISRRAQANEAAVLDIIDQEGKLITDYQKAIESNAQKISRAQTLSSISNYATGLGVVGATIGSAFAPGVGTVIGGAIGVGVGASTGYLASGNRDEVNNYKLRQRLLAASINPQDAGSALSFGATAGAQSALPRELFSVGRTRVAIGRFSDIPVTSRFNEQTSNAILRQEGINNAIQLGLQSEEGRAFVQAEKQRILDEARAKASRGESPDNIINDRLYNIRGSTSANTPDELNQRASILSALRAEFESLNPVIQEAIEQSNQYKEALESTNNSIRTIITAFETSTLKLNVGAIQQGISNENRSQFLSLISGNGGLSRVSNQIPTAIAQQINLNARTGQNSDSVFGQLSEQGVITRREVKVLSDLAKIQTSLFGSTNRVSGAIAGLGSDVDFKNIDARNAGVTAKQVFSRLFENAPELSTKEGQIAFSDIQDQFAEFVQTNLLDFQQDPEGIVKKFINGLDASSLVLNRLGAVVENTNQEILYQEQNYQALSKVTQDLLNIQLQEYTNRIASIKQRRSVGFSQRDIDSQLSGIVRNTYVSGDAQLLSARAESRFNDLVRIKQTPGATQEDITSAEIAFKQSVDAVNNNSQKLGSTISALREKFSQLDEKVSGLIRGFISSAQLSIADRNIAEIRANSFNSLLSQTPLGTGGELSKITSPQELLRYAQTVGQERFSEILRSVPLTQGTGAQQLFEGGKLAFGDLISPTGRTNAQDVQLLQFLQELSRQSGTKSFDELISSFGKLAELDKTVEQIQKEQLDSLHQIARILERGITVSFDRFESTASQPPTTSATPSVVINPPATPPVITPTQQSTEASAAFVPTTKETQRNTLLSETKSDAIVTKANDLMPVGSLTDITTAISDGFKSSFAEISKQLNGNGGGKTTISVDGTFSIEGLPKNDQVAVVRAMTIKYFQSLLDNLDASDPNSASMRSAIENSVRAIESQNTLDKASKQ